MMRLFASEFPNDNSDIHDGAVWVCRTPRGPARAVLRARAPEAPSALAVEPSPAASHSELEGSKNLVPSPARSEVDKRCERIRGPVADAPVVETVVPAEAPQAPPSVDASPIAEAPPAQTPAAPTSPLSAVPATSSAEPAEPEAPAEPVTSAFDQLLDTLAEIALARGATRLAAILPPLLYDGRVPTALCGAETRTGLASAGMASEQGSDLVLSASTADVTAAWRGVLCGGDLSACGASTLDAFCSELLAAGLGAPSAASALRRELRTRGVAAFGIIAQAA